MQQVATSLKTTNMSTCGEKSCKKGKINRNTKALQCEICELWWHIACADVTEDQYTVLKGGITGTHWFCLCCNVGSVKVLALLAEVRRELDESKETVTALKKQVVKLNFNHDRLEQYTRKDNALISNIADPHEKVEDTNSVVIQLASDIGVTINPEDISTSHRLGSLASNYDRPIIVRFARRDVKRKLMMKRKLLKDNATYPNVYLNDDLTKSRYKISKQLRELDFKVWTHDGKILFKKPDSDISVVDTYEDFCKLEWTEEKLTELGILQ